MKKIKNYTNFITEKLKPEVGFDDVANYTGFGTKMIEFVDGTIFTFNDSALEDDHITLIGKLELSNGKIIDNYNIWLTNNNGSINIVDKTHKILSMPTKDTIDGLKYIYKHLYDGLINKGDDAQYSNVRKKYYN